MFVSALSTLYSIFAVVLGLSYIPQLVRVWRDRQGAQALSLPTWGFWVISSITSLLYATFVVGKLAFIVATAGSALGCVAIFSVGAWRRLRYKAA